MEPLLNAGHHNVVSLSTTFPHLKLAHTFMINVDIQPTSRGLRGMRFYLKPYLTTTSFFLPRLASPAQDSKNTTSVCKRSSCGS